MLNDFLHIDDGHTLITAATVGTGIQEWISLEAETASSATAQKLMALHQLDVVPIAASDGQAYEYYHTLQPGQYDAVSKKPIGYRDTLPSNTHIKEIIRAFASNKRSFYFLRNSGDICGIVSLADLNNRQVKTYLYGLLCDLETDLSLFVKKELSEQEISDYLQEVAASNGPAGRKRIAEEVLHRYGRDSEGDLRIHITEYLYLSHHFWLVEERGLFDRPLKYNMQDWQALAKGINKIRNIVAHPAQPLIQQAGELHAIWQQLEAIYDLAFRLRHWSSTHLRR